MMDERGRLRTLGMLARHRRLTRGDIVAFRDAQLRRLLTHAHARVPLHRRLMETSGAQPGDIRHADDLYALPCTDREALRSVPAEDLRERDVDPGRLITKWTSGSTGVPFAIQRTRTEARIGLAFRLTALRDFGVRPSDRRVGVGGAPRPRHPRDWDWPQRALRAAGLFRRTLLYPGPDLGAVLPEMEALRPDVVLGYASVLAHLGSLLAAKPRAGIRPRVAIAGAEVLTPLRRAQIEQGFGAAVRDWYGSHEVGLIAWQCPTTELLHVTEHNVVLEVRVDGRPADVGETGEAIVTGLHAFAMPFIRYRLGDLVTRGPVPCPCGAPFATLQSVEGRTWDLFRLPDGRVVHPATINRLVQNHGVPWLRQYQLLQDRADRVLVTVVPLGAPPVDGLAALRRALADLLGPEVQLDIEIVSTLTPDASGKVHLARSLVGHPTRP